MSGIAEGFHTVLVVYLQVVAKMKIKRKKEEEEKERGEEEK